MLWFGLCVVCWSWGLKVGFEYEMDMYFMVVSCFVGMVLFRVVLNIVRFVVIFWIFFVLISFRVLLRCV